jgi:hypothetical protein
LIANVNRDPRRRPEPFKPSEFMPVFDLVEQQESEQRGLLAQLRRFLPARKSAPKGD